MPCFKGLAVSIHAADGPISEFSVQKQSRQSRISTYIPVPPAKVPPASATGKPEQSTFAISITLLTPGLNVPYSAPKPTPADPYPRPRVVGGLPGQSAGRGKYSASIPPYIPRTTNPNETIAAYIYFDGRAKEEVATLLRRGEETWVNSRWVSVPESEGGGLAERDFLFREVGLERWLNGLDLEGSSKDKQDRIERRQRRLDKAHRKRKEKEAVNSDSDDQAKDDTTTKRRNGVLRYGGHGDAPVQDIDNDEGLIDTDSDSEDEPPQPEAAGQIKIALFRVLASGEIKRGEYSPQFDAHDDDENMEKNGNGEGGDADVDHTTSFAKPKTLDPKTISTQTVTGIDPPESPYAVFTFFYRGEKQLRKMGMLGDQEAQNTPQSTKRKSSGPDFSKLAPLKAQGTVGYSGYRERKGKYREIDAMDSDAEDEDDDKLPHVPDDNDVRPENGNNHLSPEDAKRIRETAEGVGKIKLKRQHSADPMNEQMKKSPHLVTEDVSPVGTPKSVTSTGANAGTPPDGLSPASELDALASPFKRHRASEPNGVGPLGSAANEAQLPAISMSDASTNDEAKRAASTPEVNRHMPPLPPPEDLDEEL